MENVVNPQKHADVPQGRGRVEQQIEADNHRERSYVHERVSSAEFGGSPVIRYRSDDRIGYRIDTHGDKQRKANQETGQTPYPFKIEKHEVGECPVLYAVRS